MIRRLDRSNTSAYKGLVESQRSLCRWKGIQVGYVLSHLIVIKFSHNNVPRRYVPTISFSNIKK